MPYILENDSLRITIKQQGAELASIYHKGTGLEYLWQADLAYWGRHAPVLFPIVGKLKNDSYTYNGHPYHLGQHGFARDKTFKVKSNDAGHIVLALREDEETLAVYPFSFRLEISYFLNEDKLTVQYAVENPVHESMFFSIGGHPAFRCPITKDDAFEHYYLLFEKKETADRLLLDNGLFNGRKEPVLSESNILPIERDMFNKDAIVFEDLASDWVSIRSKVHEHGLKFYFPGFPYLGIWSKPGADFICLEPWHGLADNTAHTGEFESKVGLIHLKDGDRFICEYHIQPC